MYRFVSLFLFLCIINNCSGFHRHYRQHRGYGCKHHHSYRHHHNEEPVGNGETLTFVDVLKKFVEADESLQKFCTNFTQVDPLIKYGLDGCLLTYPLSDTKDFSVDAKITNRLLRITIKRENDTILFTDVRVLPNILDFKQATWSELSGVIKIAIPYKETFMTEYTPKCEDVDGDVIIIPKQPTFQFRSLY